MNLTANSIRDTHQQVSQQAQIKLSYAMAEYTEQQRAVFKQFKV